jgi:acyl-coenzyme A thioesterase PaaI-like protein
MTRRVLRQLLGGTKSSQALRRRVNLWPLFLGAGIRVARIARITQAVDVEMKLCFRNANHIGAYFGGSLFAMTDAFYMLMLMARLGRDHTTRDKAATLRYRRPGRGTGRAEFRLSSNQIDNIREKLKTSPKYQPVVSVEVKDEAGVVTAEVEETSARAEEMIAAICQSPGDLQHVHP